MYKENQQTGQASSTAVTYNVISWFAAVYKITSQNDIFVSGKPACCNFAGTFLNLYLLKVLINSLQGKKQEKL